MTARTVRAHASLHVAKPPEAVFDFITSPDAIPRTFEGHGPVPGCERVEMVTDGGLCAGAVRRVFNRDGSVVEERIVALERPRLQQYELVSGLRPPFSWLVKSAGGRWQLERAGAGTQIDWTFTFELRSALAWPIAALLGRPFATAMRKALERTRAIVEAE